jgi:hypothetical protein
MQTDTAKVKHEPSGLVHAGIVQALLGGLTLALVTHGVAGSIYKAISPNGWIAMAFGQSISAGTAVLGSLCLVLALAWFSRVYTSPRRRNRHAGLFVYFFGAAGLVYAVQLLTNGTL